MIKGVNKQIVEIKCTNNEYFDRALLFVNSSCDMFSEADIRALAGKYLEELNDEFDNGERSRDLSGDKSARALTRLLFGLVAAFVVTIVLIALG